MKFRIREITFFDPDFFFAILAIVIAINIIAKALAPAIGSTIKNEKFFFKIPP